MGIFDSAPQGQSFIDRLLALSGGANSQMGPLPSDTAQYGPPQSYPAHDPHTGETIAPQQNAQPSPLDNAQWPAGPIGAPSQANAQMPQAAPQQQPALPPQLQPPSEDGLGNHLIAGARNFLGGGSVAGAVLGGIGGLVTGHRVDAQSVAQENMRTQYQALINAGVPQQQAVHAKCYTYQESAGLTYEGRPKSLL
jgi:hypothetical protein